MNGVGRCQEYGRQPGFFQEAHVVSLLEKVREFDVS